MNTPYNFDRMDNRIVYVKTVDVADLPKQVRDILGQQMTNEDTFFPFKSIRLSAGSYSCWRRGPSE